MRALFVCCPSRAYGEINSVIPLARSLDACGGEVCFLASPLAASVAEITFPGKVFRLGPDRNENQVLFWRLVKKLRPDAILFAEMYELLRPGRQPDCPFIDGEWLSQTDRIDAAFIFIDFIAHAKILRDIACCDQCAARFGASSLRSFLSRLWVILPCPLNEPGPTDGRRGIPYRMLNLPLPLTSDQRASVRNEFLGGASDRSILVLRTGSTWQAILAKRSGVNLYPRLGNILSYYFSSIADPVTVVSVSNDHTISATTPGIRFINLKNMAPRDFERVLLACDLVLTDNEIGSTLAKTVGTLPGLVFVNSYEAEEILDRERRGSIVRKTVLDMERDQPGSVFPHKIFPIPAGEEEFFDHSSNGYGGQHRHREISSMRLGRMLSSPFFRAELYGGEETAGMCERLFGDSELRSSLHKQQCEYLNRLSTIEDGASVLERIVASDRLWKHTVM